MPAGWGDVELRGKRVRYLLPSQPMDRGWLSPTVRPLEPVDDAALAARPNVRRVVVSWLASGLGLPMVMHWADPVDLEALDARVIEGTASAADFDGATICDPRTIACLTCFATLRILAIDGGLPPLTAADDMPSTVPADVRCPVCHARLGIRAVELLGILPVDHGRAAALDAGNRIVLNRSVGGDEGELPLRADGVAAALARLDGRRVTRVLALRPEASLLVAGGPDRVICSWVGGDGAWSLLGPDRGGPETLRFNGRFEEWVQLPGRFVVDRAVAGAAAAAFAVDGRRAAGLDWERALAFDPASPPAPSHLLLELGRFAEAERSRLEAAGVAVTVGMSPEDRGKTSAWVALHRVPFSVADLTVWDSGEAELGAAWGQVDGGWQRQFAEHAEFTSVAEVRRSLERLVQLVGADRGNHGVPGDYVPRTEEEQRFLVALLGRVPDLDVWVWEDDAGPWLLVSVDLVIGNAIRDTARLDFDGCRIAGGWSPASFNWDSVLRAHAVGLGPGSPDWIDVTGTPEELADAAVGWFSAVVAAWPEGRGRRWQP